MEGLDEYLGAMAGGAGHDLDVVAPCATIQEEGGGAGGADFGEGAGEVAEDGVDGIGVAARAKEAGQHPHSG